MINNVSVIIPVYNAEKYIEKCINSLCNQTFDNYEIIIIDDGSSDNTELVVNKYKNRYKFIKYYKKNNGGVSSARNYGLSVANGKYVIFVDSDDWCEKNLIEVAYKKINEFKVDWLIYGYYIEFQNKTINTIKNDINILANNKKEIAKCIKLLEEKMLIASPWTSIYRMDILKENNIKFNENLDFGEDVLFNLEYLEAIESVYILNLPLYHYVKFDKKTLSTKYVKNRFEKMNYNIKKRKEVYDKFNMVSDEYNIHFSNMFVKSLYGSILNMFYTECELNYREKIKSIKFIMKDELYNSYITNSNLNNKIFIIFKYIYKLKSPFIMYIFMNIISKKK
ncbi:TPA: glycosyltransferase family 2 protein [Clostridium perfringens]